MLISLIIGSLVLTGNILASESTLDLSPVDFQKDIYPLLKRRCLSCHNQKTQVHGLRLDSKSSALKGGNSGTPAIVPGKSSDSLLYRYTAGLDPEIVMPPTGPRLSHKELEMIKAWIDQGADWEMNKDGLETNPLPIDHWSFQPISNPRVPEVKDGGWVKTPIDSFILAKLEAKGWKPSNPAKPYQLLRRIYLDLIGIPPTIMEQRAFLKNPSEKNFETLVNDLLSRAAYAERWARHWLDLVRYAETNGYERDATKPNAWKYRDYVIQSFDKDKPFNRFVLEQLAGDELADSSAETLVATGFFRLGPWDDEPADPLTDRFDQLDDIVSTTSQVFLGLTLGCARCHDHKFDPLTAKDYYSMVAFFNGLERPRSGRSEMDLPLGTPEQLEKYRTISKKIEQIKQNLLNLKNRLQKTHLQSGQSYLPTAVVQAFLTENKTGRRDPLTLSFKEQLEKEVSNTLSDTSRLKIKNLETKIKDFESARGQLPRGYFMHEPKPNPPPTHLLIHGRVTNPGPEVFPAVPSILIKSKFQIESRGETSGRRLALARWLTHSSNPLTARVIVNRVWQKHFGYGLVRSPNNFGLIGEKPTHPRLLDWLAHWFIKQGWSLKKLHRLIVTSQSYQMNRQLNPHYMKKDPENLLLWRLPRVRLEVEAIRDSMLAVSGRLNRKMYGPSMFPQISEGALAGHSDPDTVWKSSIEEERSRRTIYVFLKRSMVVPMLEVLDLCDTTKTAPKRITTNVAPQALTLFNGEFVNRQARYLASRLGNEVGANWERQIKRAFILALARPPTLNEKKILLKFLREESQNQLDNSKISFENARSAALREMCRVILNLNEFVYPD